MEEGLQVWANKKQWDWEVLLMSKKQEPPFTIKVELTEGCCLACEFCGINGIKTDGFNYLPLSRAIHIAKLIRKTGWNSKIEFTMRGEPTLNPELIDIIKTFRKHLPDTQLMITSNGGGLLKTAKLVGLFDAGLNILALDDYEHADFVPKIREAFVKEKVSEAGINWFEYPKDKISPNKRYPSGTKMIVAIEDIGSTGSVGSRKLSNHCGAAAPKVKTMAKRCARPFRELIIRWDGHVLLCCNDWRGEMSMAHIDGASDLIKVWNNKVFKSARKLLYAKDRGFRPCVGCNNISFRVGFLPDKMGKETLPAPTEADRKCVAEATAGCPLTEPVKRPWETGMHGIKKFLKGPSS
jgi:hypothetical protein